MTNCDYSMRGIFRTYVLLKSYDVLRLGECVMFSLVLLADFEEHGGKTDRASGAKSVRTQEAALFSGNFYKPQNPLEAEKKLPELVEKFLNK